MRLATISDPALVSFQRTFELGYVFKKSFVEARTRLRLHPRKQCAQLGIVLKIELLHPIQTRECGKFNDGVHGLYLHVKTYTRGKGSGIATNPICSPSRSKAVRQVGPPLKDFRHCLNVLYTRNRSISQVL